MCAHHELHDLIPGFSNMNLTISTASGGTLGYLLHQSLGDLAAYPPPLDPDLTYEQLQKDQAPPAKQWWSNIAWYLPNMHPPEKPSPHLPNAVAGSACDPVPNDRTGWWQDVMVAAFKVAYGIPRDEVGVRLGVGHLIQNFAVVEQDGLPMQRDLRTGQMLRAKDFLHLGTLEAVPGDAELRLHIAGGLSLDHATGANFTLLDGTAWSTSFWAHSVIEDKRVYDAERLLEEQGRGVLISACASANKAPGRETMVHLIDGGFVDTTGIVALLQRRASHILTLYGSNECLQAVGSESQCETASVAYLFGHIEKTDAMNSLAGPTLTQVFPTHFYEGVLQNLTDPRGLLVHLKKVPVLRNSYLEVEPFILEDLIIVSNHPVGAFLSSFSDPRVRGNLDPAWPDRFPVSMDVFNANMLCEFNRWKLQRHAAELRDLFARGTGKNEAVII
eukprot:gnl/TRDRNA2_/TRDRNA2_72258_c0_seq1.p1 gnl/TRDRNA2_/TRDRNA2_72258_c0~~gnl/TRDRNA2_/TRDRNA2_72258_c0_seq1.p1  ORF type:complete len:452 (+),score=78.66 gnl/TRDRNA2_/TRDRNA2_72258_c0_seq1:24-1358(+)